jgi:simple sugar transport system substrate-binding protein/basic membrane protein A
VNTAAAAVLAICLLALTACGSASDGPASSAPGAAAKLTVGFVMVGSTKDAGYNQAVDVAAQKVKADLGVNVLTADQIAENANVTQTMQAMVDEGAKVIFATSYGYFPYAEKFARSHPDITVLHQGGYLDTTFPKNFGTYWGASYDPVSLGGMAAGGVTKTNQLGFVYAFPIAQTIANINAFQLGAKQVNPNATTHIVSTSSWCDPLKQKQAVDALFAQNVDVISNHQDCQTTMIQAAKTANKYFVGYHFDAKDLDPDGWLTGSAWNWAPVYENIIKTVEAGTFTGGDYNKNWTGFFSQQNNPIELASFGKSVPAELQTKILAAEKKLKQPDGATFVGPIYCQDGKVLVPAGKTATYVDVVTKFDCLVQGVVGSLGKSS